MNAEARAMSERRPYVVEVDAEGCQRCGHGRTWTVVNFEDVAIGRSFGDKYDAEDLAHDMNVAYIAGHNSKDETR